LIGWNVEEQMMAISQRFDVNDVGFAPFGKEVALLRLAQSVIPQGLMNQVLSFHAGVGFEQRPMV
jgi:hypothetical protein